MVLIRNQQRHGHQQGGQARHPQPLDILEKIKIIKKGNKTVIFFKLACRQYSWTVSKSCLKRLKEVCKGVF
jgi:hypothetical protein